MHASKRQTSLYLFEFSSHVRVVNKLESLIRAVFPSSFSLKAFAPKGLNSNAGSLDYDSDIVFLNTVFIYFLLAYILLFKTRDKVFITTSPEHGSNWKKKLFMYVLLFFDRNRRSVVFLRDISYSAAGYYLQFPHFMHEFRFICESPYLCDFLSENSNAIPIGFLVPGYCPINLDYCTKTLLPQAIHDTLSNVSYDKKSQLINKFNVDPISIGLLGSLDIKRRDYDDIFLAVKLLSLLNVDVHLYILGSTAKSCAKSILTRFDQYCNVVTSDSAYCSDSYLDYSLTCVHILVSCNRYEYYRGHKGSGCYGDAFLASKPLIMPANFNESTDTWKIDGYSAPLYYYSSASELAAQIYLLSAPSGQAIDHAQTFVERLLYNQVRCLRSILV